MSLARNTAWAAAAAVTMTGARFALAAILARRLVQAAFGQYAYGGWLVDLSFLVCSLGVTGVAGRYVAEYYARPERLAALMVVWRPLALGLPALAGIAVLLGASVSGLHLGLPAMAMLMFWAATNGRWAMQTAVLTGMQRFDLILRANALAATIMLAGALLLPLTPANGAILFGMMAVAYGAASLVGISITGRVASGTTGSIEPAGWRGIRSYAVNMWVTALLWSLVWSRGEMPIVRAYLGDTGVAHYAAAMTLFGGAIQGVMLAVSGIAPQLTMMWGSGRRAETVNAARTIMDVQLLFCGAGALILICLGPELISLAFGRSYHDAVGPLMIFSLGLLAMAVSSQNYVLQIASDARFSRNVTLLGLVLLFAAAMVLTPVYGLIGTAISRAGTMLVLAAVSLVTITRRWGAAAISGRNVLVVTTVVTVTALSLAMRERGGLFRAVLLGITLIVLAISLRDARGRLLSTVLPGVFLRLFSSRTGNAATSTGRSQ